MKTFPPYGGPPTSNQFEVMVFNIRISEHFFYICGQIGLLQWIRSDQEMGKKSLLNKEQLPLNRI